MFMLRGFAFVYGHCLNFVVMTSIDLTFILKKFGIQAKYEGRVYAISAFAFDLRCQIVEGIEMVYQDI